VFVGLQRIFFAGRAGCDPKKFEKHFGLVMDSHTFVERISQ
ncbi:MAG: hypothetical protein K0Q83_2614, partial [Deltaproteobacteria bacterium]|nr:hypothetical protein [Deltaproteobacteria bacterium]